MFVSHLSIMKTAVETGLARANQMAAVIEKISEKVRTTCTSFSARLENMNIITEKSYSIMLKLDKAFLKYLNRINVSKRLGINLPIDKQEFKRMIEKQIKNEKRAVNLLYDSAEKTNNMVIRLTLYQLALDSARHEHMLNAILQLLEFPSEEQFESESEEFSKVIEKHVEIERKMLGDFEKIVDKTEDKRIRFILQDIISDEKKHHAITKRMYELLCESERVKDAKWWDFLFRYSHLSG